MRNGITSWQKEDSLVIYALLGAYLQPKATEARKGRTLFSSDLSLSLLLRCCRKSWSRECTFGTPHVFAKVLALMATTFSGLELTDVNTARPVYAPMLLSVPVSNGTLHDVVYEPLWLWDSCNRCFYLCFSTSRICGKTSSLRSLKIVEWYLLNDEISIIILAIRALWIFREANIVLSKRGIFVTKIYGKVSRKFSMKEARVIGVGTNAIQNANVVVYDWKCLWRKALLINRARIDGTFM